MTLMGAIRKDKGVVLWKRGEKINDNNFIGLLE